MRRFNCNEQTWRRLSGRPIKQGCLVSSLFLLLLYNSWWWLRPLYLFRTAWKWTTYSDPHVSRVTQCLAASASRKSKNETEIHLAVVIPFIPKETELLLPLLQTWDVDGSLPCTTTSSQLQQSTTQKHSTELVFYISQSFDKDETSKNAKRLIRSTIQQVKSIATCFSGFHFINAGLTDDEDAYRDKGRGWSNSGPNVMFYNMPHRIRDSLPRVTHVAYLEVDAAYIRNDWIQSLWNQCTWDTWVVGNAGRLPKLHQSSASLLSSGLLSPSTSTCAGGPTRNAPLQPWRQRKENLIAYTRQHPSSMLYWYEPARFENPYCDPSFSLNGNAIYTIGDGCFVEFVQRLRETPPFVVSYDHNMLVYRCHPLHADLTRAVLGKFVLSEVMVDARHLLWNRNYVNSHMKDTVVITQADGQDNRLSPSEQSKLQMHESYFVIGAEQWRDLCF